MRDCDISLELKIACPDIMLYCTDESQERLSKCFLKLLKKLGNKRFCAEMAVFIRSIKTEQYATRLKEVKK